MPVYVDATTYISDAELLTEDELLADEDLLVRDAARTKAKGLVDEAIEAIVTTPIQRKSDGTFNSWVKELQANYTLWLLYKNNDKETAQGFLDSADDIVERIREGKIILDQQVAETESGIQIAVPGDSNGGTGFLFVDRTQTYGDTKRRLFTCTIDGKGASKTATFKYKNSEDTSYTENQVTTFEWFDIGYGVRVMFSGNETDSFLVNDTWTIQCIPNTERTVSDGFTTAPIRNTAFPNSFSRISGGRR